MIKNLQITGSRKINKIILHKLVANLKKEFSFKIAALEINFIDKMEMLKINKKYLKHNFSTDVITFNYGTVDKLEGEIYISLDDAASNATKYRVPLNKEIFRLVIHGILHLIGYEDSTDKERKVMKKMENSLVNRYYVNYGKSGSV